MENNTTIDHILEKLELANRQFYRILFIVSPSERARENITLLLHEKTGDPIINVNLEVSRQILELPAKQRPLHVAKIPDSLVKTPERQTFIFKNIEHLFNPSLKPDPIRLFKQIARNKTLVIAWNGNSNGQFLTYAVPNHPDYKKYPASDLIIINIDEDSPQSKGAI